MRLSQPTDATTFNFSKAVPQDLALWQPGFDADYRLLEVVRVCRTVATMRDLDDDSQYTFNPKTARIRSRGAGQFATAGSWISATASMRRSRERFIPVFWALQKRVEWVRAWARTFTEASLCWEMQEARGLPAAHQIVHMYDDPQMNGQQHGAWFAPVVAFEPGQLSATVQCDEGDPSDVEGAAAAADEVYHQLLRAYATEFPYPGWKHEARS